MKRSRFSERQTIAVLKGQGMATADEGWNAYQTLLTSLGHAALGWAHWRHDYNHYRPHSSFGNKASAEMGAGSNGESS